MIVESFTFERQGICTEFKGNEVNLNVQIERYMKKEFTKKAISETIWQRGSWRVCDKIEKIEDIERTKNFQYRMTNWTKGVEKKVVNEQIYNGISKGNFGQFDREEVEEKRVWWWYWKHRRHRKDKEFFSKDRMTN